MANIIKVDPQRLRNASSEFAATSAQIASATGNMTQTVTSLTGSVWTGDAGSAFVNKFSGLNDEIRKIDTMIKEHADDLSNMANEYERAESANMMAANSLNDNVF